jgi:hypothetical protein
MNEQIVRRFREFARANGIDLVLENVDFEMIDFFNHSEIELLGPRKIGNHSELGEINDERGLPVFDASSGVLCYVSKEKYPSSVFEVEDEENPPFSFANEGNSSAGTNFIFHTGEFFINNHRTLVKIKSKEVFNSRFVFFSISKMKEEYGFRRGYIPSQTELSRLKIQVPIPKPSQGLSSFQIQEILVRFIEHGQAEHQRQLDKCAALRPILDKMEHAVVPRVLEKSRGAKKKMREFLQEKGIELDYENLEFETLRVHSDNYKELVCSKRMGFTPTRDPEGNVNWFTVADLNSDKRLYIDNPSTKEKTTIEKVKEAVGEKSIKFKSIEKGDVLVSFKLTVGVTKIYDSDELAYCNEAIDILTPNERVTSEYLAINCMVEYPKYGSITNNGKTLNDDHKKEIEVKIPRDLGNFSSIEIQKILVEFIFKYLKTVNCNRNVADRLEAGVARYREAHLKLFFESLKQKAHAD